MSPLVIPRFRSVYFVEVLVCSCGCSKCLRCISLLSDSSGLVAVVLGHPSCSKSCFSVASGCFRLFQDVSGFI